MSALGVFLETVRPWASTGGILAITGVALRFYLDNRRMKIAENVDDRAGYGVLIKALQEDVVLVRADHRKCEERLSKIEGELMGFHRQALVQSQNGVASLPASEMVRAAGERAAAAIDKAASTKKEIDQ